jgi:hypothetical protein
MWQPGCGSAHQQIPVRTGPQRLEKILVSRRRRHHHDLRFGERLLDQARDLNSASRKVDRDDADIRFVRRGETHRILGIGGLRNHVKAVWFDRTLDSRANSGLVVSDKNS